MAERWGRIVVRLVRFLYMTVTGLWDSRRRVRPGERRAGVTDYLGRAQWIHRHALRTARFLRIDVEVVGTPPRAQLYASNHVSYLDVVAIACAAPAVFVAKAEVRGWPIVGALATAGGTLYVRRDRRADVADIGREFDAVAASGAPVVVFLEGTSSSGEGVLAFRSSFLGPAVERAWTVAPVGVDYFLDDGDVVQEVAFWRDMSFAPHFLNLLSKRRIRARVSFGAAQPAGGDRKALAVELRDAVIALRAKPAGPAAAEA